MADFMMADEDYKGRKDENKIAIFKPSPERVVTP
jgi:hypothetical protein